MTKMPLVVTPIVNVGILEVPGSMPRFAPQLPNALPALSAQVEKPSSAGTTGSFRLYWLGVGTLRIWMDLVGYIISIYKLYHVIIYTCNCMHIYLFAMRGPYKCCCPKGGHVDTGHVDTGSPKWASFALGQSIESWTCWWGVSQQSIHKMYSQIASTLQTIYMTCRILLASRYHPVEFFLVICVYIYMYMYCILSLRIPVLFLDVFRYLSRSRWYTLF